MTEIPEGYMEDQHGRLVPESKVKPINKLRDQTVRSIVDEAKRKSRELAQFKAGAMADVGSFLETSAEQYDTSFGGQKGNVSLTSFDGRYKVQRAISERLGFDERLQVAKAAIDECIHRWASETNDNIKALVEHAFQVDKEGKLNTSRILGLRRLDIDDPKWQEAMQAIDDSIRVEASKTYLRIYERNDSTGKYEPVALDIAAL
jgi:hypothetical protein